MFLRSSIAGCEMITLQSTSAAFFQHHPEANLLRDQAIGFPRQSLRAFQFHKPRPQGSRRPAVGSQSREGFLWQSYIEYSTASPDAQQHEMFGNVWDVWPVSGDQNV